MLFESGLFNSISVHLDRTYLALARYNLLEGKYAKKAMKED